MFYVTQPFSAIYTLNLYYCTLTHSTVLVRLYCMLWCMRMSGNLAMSYIHRKREMSVCSLPSFVVCFQLGLVTLHWLCVKIQLNMNQTEMSWANRLAISLSLNPHFHFLPFLYPLTLIPYVKQDIFLLTLSPSLPPSSLTLNAVNEWVKAVAEKANI